jgi:hypothetical protein
MEFVPDTPSGVGEHAGIAAVIAASNLAGVFAENLADETRIGGADRDGGGGLCGGGFHAPNYSRVIASVKGKRQSLEWSDMPKFKSVSGGHVRIFRQDNPSGLIDIDEGGFYETDDKGEIEALRDSTEVEEVKTQQESKSFGDKEKAR